MRNLRGLTGGALDLLVALVADKQDVVAVAGEALGLVVHLGHQRAGSVEGEQVTVLGGVAHRGRDAVGGEHQVGAFGHLVGLVDEDHAALLQRFHDVLVVHDLFAHVDGGTVLLQGLFYGLHCAVDTSAVAARGCEEDFFTLFCHGTNPN